MGETYGFNMRHYGAKYINCKTSYTEPLHQGYDQLAAIIELLRTEPESRRIIINLWNPATQDKAALPSCLCQYQFWVNTTTWELSLQIYIRSSDYYLANNWNTCTGALFVHLLCNTPELQHLHPGELIVTMGDTHIYSTHIAQATENSSRIPLPYPKLHVKCVKPITEFVWNDIALIGYKSLPKIAATMAV
jgi:thymidylate synthase